MDGIGRGRGGRGLGIDAESDDPKRRRGPSRLIGLHCDQMEFAQEGSPPAEQPAVIRSAEKLHDSLIGVVVAWWDFKAFW